jgi:hypothetical protein
MSVESEDILFKLATDDGPGDTNSSSPNASLGGFLSTTELVNNSVHNLFAEISGNENLNELVKYRCLFVQNDHPEETFFNIRVFISDQEEEGAEVHIGLDPTAATDPDSATAQAVEIANEDTAPAGVSFSQPEDYDSGLNLGDLEAGQVRAIWFRRTARNTPAFVDDNVTFRVQGESL